MDAGRPRGYPGGNPGVCTRLPRAAAAWNDQCVQGGGRLERRRGLEHEARVRGERAARDADDQDLLAGSLEAAAPELVRSRKHVGGTDDVEGRDIVEPEDADAARIRSHCVCEAECSAMPRCPLGHLSDDLGHMITGAAGFTPLKPDLETHEGQERQLGPECIVAVAADREEQRRML